MQKNKPRKEYMGAKFWIDQIQFSDTNKIKFEKNDIVVLVGPNNAGKSASLREIVGLTRANHFKGKVVKNLNIVREGTENDLFSMIVSKSMVDNSKDQPLYKGFGFSFFHSVAKSNWNNYKDGLQQLSPLFCNIVNTEQRLLAANPADNIQLTKSPLSHPIHFLQKYDSLEEKFCDYFHQAFGTDLIVHRNSGNVVPLYVGEKPVLQTGEDRVSESYLKNLESLDLLQEQGDGMRSFVGLLLNVFVWDYSLLLIDEPEAFLHPPQARLLGKMLAKDLPVDRQLFLATHSESFLKGLLDANISNLKIIRLQREGFINRVSILNSVDIKNMWNDSLLRHSNILDGLFHSRVVICESDSDSRFFSAVLSALFDDTNNIAPDVLFINCGGKHRIPIAIKALKKLNVPIKVVADFDVLNDINPLKDIFDNLGGEWQEVEGDWKVVRKEIEQKRPEFLTSDVKTELESILNSTTERIFPKQKITQIQKVLKKASAWTEAKEIGRAFIPSGNASQSFEKMQGKFAAHGLLIPEVGELESFAKSIGNHGPKWVSDVLTKDLKNDPELETARRFVGQLIS